MNDAAVVSALVTTYPAFFLENRQPQMSESSRHVHSDREANNPSANHDNVVDFISHVTCLSSLVLLQVPTRWRAELVQSALIRRPGPDLIICLLLFSWPDRCDMRRPHFFWSGSAL